ncbi:Alpha/beta hydrolase family protein [Pseudovibrio sp. Ad13]|uniref:alpha/beta fold hydrolase n=1 Tax=Pseudovibrio sp. Ad13 TaxID=989396 RepID=UPI0007B2A5AA|nr:alpha/beta fold hydrolase [Pseudovibrio sp. Ad13]KZK75922.1 Alpha/beta hydrolase family protein [Pseudovibrio sp. Ad13]
MHVCSFLWRTLFWTPHGACELFTRTFKLPHHDLPPGPERDDKLVGVSIADYVEDARQAIAEIGEAPVVVGHSIGGVIAQLLAAEGAIKAGVLLNTAL